MTQVEQTRTGLLLRIARCAVVEQQLGTERDPTHPCDQVVRWQQENGFVPHHLPEPWNGCLQSAKALFISSNPAIGYDEHYPDSTWSDDDVERFFRQRFGEEPDSPITDGKYTLKRDRQHRNASTKFLAAVRLRAAELGLHRPGIDYALTEVVHCKTPSERLGSIRSAMSICVPRYASAVLRASNAPLLVFLGDIAKEGAQALLPGLALRSPLVGPVDIAGQQRWMVFLPHPTGFKGPKTLGGVLGEELLAKARLIVAQTNDSPDGCVESSEG